MKRVYLGKFVDFASAKQVKDLLIERNPGLIFQIRRIHNGFKLVRRDPS